MSHVNFLSIRSRDLIIKFWDGNHTTKSSILTHFRPFLYINREKWMNIQKKMLICRLLNLKTQEVNLRALPIL